MIEIRENCRVYYERSESFMKINLAKVATVGALLLSFAGSILASWAGERRMEETITKEVEKAVKNLK